MAVISLYTVGEKIKEAIRDSAAILALSQSLFSVPHAIQTGAAAQESPEVGASPEFVLIGLTKSDPKGGDKSFEFLLMIEVRQATTVTTTSANGVVVKSYQGQKDIEDFADLAWSDIQNISPNLQWERGELEISPLSFYPLFSGSMSLKAVVPYVFGATVTI